MAWQVCRHGRHWHKGLVNSRENVFLQEKSEKADLLCGVWVCSGLCLCLIMLGCAQGLEGACMHIQQTSAAINELQTHATTDWRCQLRGALCVIAGIVRSVHVPWMGVRVPISARYAVLALQIDEEYRNARQAQHGLEPVRKKPTCNRASGLLALCQYLCKYIVCLLQRARSKQPNNHFRLHKFCQPEQATREDQASNVCSLAPTLPLISLTALQDLCQRKVSWRILPQLFGLVHVAHRHDNTTQLARPCIA